MLVIPGPPQAEPGIQFLVHLSCCKAFTRPAGEPSRRPCGHFPPPAAMLGVANGAPAARRGRVGKPEGWRAGDGMDAGGRATQGAVAGCAPVRCTYRDVRSTNPVAASRTRTAGARRARHRGGLLLGYFFLARQEEVTRSPAGRVKALQLKKKRTGFRVPPAAAPE
jgi:hypothetical protein